MHIIPAARTPAQMPPTHAVVERGEVYNNYRVGDVDSTAAEQEARASRTQIIIYGKYILGFSQDDVQPAHMIDRLVGLANWFEWFQSKKL